MYSMKQEELRRHLLALRGQQRGAEFARLLDVPEATWRHYETGLRRLGPRLAMAIETAYPRLKPLVREALKERRNGGSNSAA